MRRLLLPLALSVGLSAAAGCYAGYGYETGPSYAYAGGANLAYVAPGVEAVTDFGYPIFYSNGYYYRWDNNYWYRSPYWNAGFAYTGSVPPGIAGIRRPWAYRYYHPAYRYGYRPIPRAHFSYGYGRGYYGRTYRGRHGYYRY